MMESIKKYQSYCHGVMKVPFAYKIRKAITVQTYGNYPKYATPDNEMITRMIHLHKITKNYTMNKVHSQLWNKPQRTR